MVKLRVDRSGDDRWRELENLERVACYSIGSLHKEDFAGYNSILRNANRRTAELKGTVLFYICSEKKNLMYEPYFWYKTLSRQRDPFYGTILYNYCCAAIATEMLA